MHPNEVVQLGKDANNITPDVAQLEPAPTQESFASLTKELRNLQPTVVNIQDLATGLPKDGDTVTALKKQVAAASTAIDSAQKQAGKLQTDIDKHQKKVQDQVEIAKKQAGVVTNKANQATEHFPEFAPAVKKPHWCIWVMVGLYILSLCIAVGFWAYPQPNGPDAVITNLGRSLLGLLLGALSAVLTI
jgi:chemotaxis response regulator CheB